MIAQPLSRSLMVRALYATRDIAAAIYRKQHYDFYKNIYAVATQQNFHYSGNRSCDGIFMVLIVSTFHLPSKP